MYPIRVSGWLNMSIVSTKYGEMRIIDTDEVVSHSLSMYGEWASEELNLLSQLIQPDMCVLDVGAFIGTHSLAFSKFVGYKGKVYSFEPRKEVYAVLSENLSINNCNNVVAFNIALSDSVTTLKLNSLDLNEKENFGALSVDNDIFILDSITYKINVSTIDGLALGKVDFIKIDVEGMERQVLDGALETLFRDRPIIFCECNSLAAGYKIVEFCQNQQLDIYVILSSAYNPNNFNAIKENFFGEAKELSFLLIPKEKKEDINFSIINATLIPINTFEDLVLPLLHKPQYAYEILKFTSSYPSLGNKFPSPQYVDLKIFISSLNKSITESDTQITSLNNALLERGTQITSLNNALLERGTQITSLNNALLERDTQITSLNNALLERDNQISSLNSKISEYDVYVQQLISSKSWIITKPMRWVSRIIRGDFIAAADPIKKIFYSNKSLVLLLQDDKVSNKPLTDGLYIKPSPIKPTHPVAVILPVYRGVEMTKCCIVSAMPGILSIPEARIIVINDASPDKGMQEMLEQFAAQWPNVFFLLENEKNLGFVGTVNRGFTHFPQHDPVLLNSDVIVPTDWLSRLIDEAYSKNNIGTVTPFANNATLCSFPYFMQENPVPFNLDVDTIDAVFKANKLPCVIAPTGVGFCMYIRRSCLDEIGYLNEEQFGRGYGEENDLCQRALKKGWLNILSPNIYAYHEGGVSFSSDKQGLVDNAIHVIQKLHPSYHLDVQIFIQLDPLKSIRTQRYIQLLSHIAIPKVLMVTHALGGGISQHLQEINDYYDQRIVHILLTTGDNKGEIHIILGIDRHADRLVFNISTDYADIIKFLKNIGINAVHFHHMINLDLRLLSLPHELNVPHIFTIHDYYYLHGNPTLTDINGKYPGYYDEKAINPLHQLSDELTVESLRVNLSQALESAAYVIFPSNSTKEIFTSIYSKLNAVIAPHIEMDRDVFKKPTIFKQKNSYNVGALGALCREKGADLLEQVALVADKSIVPIKFKLLGYAYRPLKKVETTGPYISIDLLDLIKKHQLDIIFFSAQCPETYSYTLSSALNTGLPIIAPNIGAFPERLSERENTLIYTYSLLTEEIFDLITGFIKNLEAGNTVKAPKFSGDESVSGFYDSTYIEIVSGKFKEVDNNQIESTVPDLSSYVYVSKQVGSKSSLLSLLVRLRMHPSSRWLSSVVPKRLRQLIVKKLNGSSFVCPQELIKSKDKPKLSVKVSHQKKHKKKRRHR